ncbi:alkane 1-monooxygenase [Rhodobacteraceae bacterium D3-12]|nr:alkane 1-monooxygenase [Rhodobacteraceae bacterium D3-12]
MSLFALATVLPVVLIAGGVIVGGFWPLAGLLYMTVFTAVLDRFVPRLLPEMPEGAEFPTGKGFSTLLGLGHFGLLAVVIAAMNGEMAATGKVVTVLAAGLWFGQVSHPNAHELIHRSERYARALGRLAYSTIGFGHHASAHLLVHHVHVGTDADPNSAAKGTGFYRFATKAWKASFIAGLKAENARAARAQRKRSVWQNPYVGYIATPVLVVIMAASVAGAWGVGGYLALCLYAQMQILLADYVQHYGLRRAMRENGKPEPVTDAHSWNSPHWFSSALMVNAPRHSDHHLHPTRPYPGLRLREAMPMMPYSLPVMAVLALFPPIWRKMMARELRRLPVGGGSA